MKKPFLRLLAMLLIAPFVACVLFRGYLGWRYESDCKRHLTAAAYAHTAGQAEKELAKALEAAERRGWTRGHTALLGNAPEDGVGLWYRRIKTWQQRLAAVPPHTFPYRLRESLTSKEGAVRVPWGLSAHPHNRRFLAAFVACGMLGMYGSFLLSKRNSRSWAWPHRAAVAAALIASGIAMMNA